MGGTTVVVGVGLAVALVVLLGLPVAASWVGELRIERDVVVASLRAAVHAAHS